MQQSNTKSLRTQPHLYKAAAFCFFPTFVFILSLQGLEAAIGVWGYAVAQLAAPIACIGYLACVTPQIKNHEKEKNNVSSRRLTAASLLVFAAAYLLFYCSGVLYGNLFDWFDMFTIGGNRIYMTCSLPIALIIFALIPAVCEQLLLQFCAASVKSNVAALILAAITSALLHLRDGVFGWALIGIALTFIFLRTGRILFCIIAHFFINSVTILLTRMNEIISISTGSRIDFAMKNGMNGFLIAGFTLIAVSIATILFSGAKSLFGKKFTVIEIAIIIVLSAAMLIIGIILTSAGNT